jgi:hypothetical protein
MAASGSLKCAAFPQMSLELLVDLSEYPMHFWRAAMYNLHMGSMLAWAWPALGAIYDRHCRPLVVDGTQVLVVNLTLASMRAALSWPHPNEGAAHKCQSFGSFSLGIQLPAIARSDC